MDVLSYYASYGPMTDPGEHADLYAGLPRDIAGLCQAVQNNLVHIFWAERYGLNLTDAQKQTVGVRPARRKLALLRQADDRPLCQPRPLEQRQVGNCRDFSLLLASCLRHQGVPARTRCGFGRYFLPNHFEDHWVCEYWNAGQRRWVLVDAQLDALQRSVLGIAFDPLDVPRDQFTVAGEGWQMCRQGLAAADDFGIFDMHGWRFIWGNVARELLAFNKMEVLPWDYEAGLFQLSLEEPPRADNPNLAEFDRLAALTTAGDAAFDELRRLYETDARFRVPGEWSA